MPSNQLYLQPEFAPVMTEYKVEEGSNLDFFFFFFYHIMGRVGKCMCINMCTEQVEKNYSLAL